MKRDMDLLRQILFEVEKLPFTGGFDTIVIPNRSMQEIAYHIYLAHNAGLLDALDASSHDGPNWYAKHLTYEGHEFLEAARDDTRWNKAKETVMKNVGSLTLDALKTALSLAIQKAVIGGL